MYQTLLTIWIAAAVAAFVALLRIPAPYGRHRSERWGPTMFSALGWLAMELPSPIILTFFVLEGQQIKTAVTWLFVALWWVHYINRSILYPLRIRGSGSRIPIAVVCMGFAFHVFNGYIVGSYFGENGPVYRFEWLSSPAFVIGSVLFLSGMWINLRSDGELIRQRRNAHGRYIIPRGGLFDYVSAPNYLGEIVEWLGFAVMTWSPAALAFAIWTAANLAPRAISHHKWYRETFPDYPEERKALVPFVV
ncbi:MAG: DUF1295 domain-containing protein [Rhodothermales bacterium]